VFLALPSKKGKEKKERGARLPFDFSPAGGGGGVRREKERGRGNIL